MSSIKWYIEEFSTEDESRRSLKFFVEPVTKTQKIVKLTLNFIPKLCTLFLEFNTVETAKDFQTYLETYLHKYLKMPEGERIKLSSRSLEDPRLIFDFPTETIPSTRKNDQVFLLMALKTFDESLSVDLDNAVLEQIFEKMDLMLCKVMTLYFHEIMQGFGEDETLSTTLIKNYEDSPYLHFPTNNSFKAALMFAERFDLSLHLLDLCQRKADPYLASIALLGVPDTVLNQAFGKEVLAQSPFTSPPSEVEALVHAAIGGVLPPSRSPIPHSGHCEMASFLFSTPFIEEDETTQRLRLTLALAHALLIETVKDRGTLGQKIYGELCGNPFGEGLELPIFNYPTHPGAHLQTIQMAFSLSLTAQREREQNLKIKALEAELQRLKLSGSRPSSSLSTVVYGAGAVSSGEGSPEDLP